MSKDSPETGSDAPLPPVPEWLVSWVGEARRARENGSEPVCTVQERYEHIHRGIKVRERARGIRYEVTSGRTYVGMADTREQAIEMRERFENG